MVVVGKRLYNLRVKGLRLNPRHPAFKGHAGTDQFTLRTLRHERDAIDDGSDWRPANGEHRLALSTHVGVVRDVPRGLPFDATRRNVAQLDGVEEGINIIMWREGKSLRLCHGRERARNVLPGIVAIHRDRAVAAVNSQIARIVARVTCPELHDVRMSRNEVLQGEIHRRRPPPSTAEDALVVRADSRWMGKSKLGRDTDSVIQRYVRHQPKVVGDVLPVGGFSWICSVGVAQSVLELYAIHDSRCRCVCVTQHAVGAHVGVAGDVLGLFPAYAVRTCGECYAHCNCHGGERRANRISSFHFIPFLLACAP